jgi:hypothetical protein
VEVLPRAVRVERPAPLVCEEKRAHGRDQDGAARLDRDRVALAAPEEDDGREAEDDGGQGEAEPEADVALGVGHADLADERADVDEEVEPVVDLVCGDCRVDNDALARLGESDDAHGAEVELFDDERANVGLEAASAEANDDDAHDERSERAVWILQHEGQGGDDEDQVADDVDAEGDRDGPEPAPVLVGDEGAKERHGVLEELVEGGDGKGGALAAAEGAGLGVVVPGVEHGAGGGAGRHRLLDVVGQDIDNSIVREALAQLDKGDAKDFGRQRGRDAPQSLQLLGGRVVLAAGLGRSHIRRRRGVAVVLFRLPEVRDLEVAHQRGLVERLDARHFGDVFVGVCATMGRDKRR